MDTPTPRPCPLRPGWHVQVYRDAIRGADRPARLFALEAGLRACATAGAVGAVAHGFVGDLTPERFAEFAALAARYGLQPSAAFGLGQGNSHAPERAGEWCARVALHPQCAALVIDAEGAWEDEASDRAAATAMGRAFRALAPAAYVVTQPWPVPTVHSSFPDAEFSAWVDADARQAYYNDWKRQLGRARVPTLRARFAASQARLFARLGPLARPQHVTLQGYAWGDVLPDLVTELLRTPVAIVWSEPFPDVDFLRGAAAVKVLRARGFDGPSAVALFQASAGLVADGIAGPKTFAALGL